ncbi:hypothetical protein F0562_020351 [Nyssa sinensis]|uniref:Uncharacterized protein n=1 Tax=Nyssa sinensis TaxID=561372 RepID=A0A5J5BUX1_9ASTE|nr:hypothetical protein F0562_020351 [Nyssa sinensis]
MDELLKNQMFVTHMIAAAGSVTLGTALTYPLDTIKSLIQVGSGSSKQLTTAQVLDRVRTFSGNSGLYNGLGWLTPGRILGLGARFGVYEIMTAFYKDGRVDNYVYVSEALMAGIAAGAMESLITSPFELIKLRAQVTSASRFPNATPLTERSAVSPFIARLLTWTFSRHEGIEPVCCPFVPPDHQTSQYDWCSKRVPMDDDWFRKGTIYLRSQKAIGHHLFGRMGCFMERSSVRCSS